MLLLLYGCDANSMWVLVRLLQLRYDDTAVLMLDEAEDVMGGFENREVEAA